MYIGNDLQIAHPSYKIIDDISSGFNGSTTSFALQVSGATPVPFPISTQQVMISVNGVVQEPDPNGSAGFKLLGSNIVFSSAPANGHAFFGVINAGADYVTAGSEFPDGSATAPSFTFQDDQDTGWFRSSSGAVGYSANGVQTLTFDGNGLTVTTGNVTIPDKIIHSGDTNTAIRFPAADTFAVETAGSERFRINSAGNIGIGGNAPNYQVHATTGIGIGAHGFAQQLSLGDDTIQSLILGTGYTTLNLNQLGGNVDIANDTSKLRLGTSQDLQLYHDGSHSHLVSNTGNLRILADGAGELVLTAKAGEEAITCAQDGTVELMYDNVKKFETQSTGVKFTGELRGNDDERIKLGNSQDLQIYHHTGHDSYVSNSTGFLSLRSTEDVRLVSDSNEFMVKAIINGAVELYYDNSKKFETTSAGVTVTGGSITSNGITQYALPTIANGGQFGWDDGTKSLRLYANSSTGSNATVQFHFNQSGTAGITFNQDSSATFGGTVSDSKGDLRKIIQNTQGSSYTLVAADAGKHILASGTVTVPNSVFSAGDAVTIVNNTASNLTITKSISTMYNAADGSSANRTLAARGMVTILFTSGTVSYISGAGLS
jgi:hypothetical protein